MTRHLHLPRKVFTSLFILATGGGILFGYDIGIVSGALIQLKTNFNLSCLQQEMVVSSMLLGALLGSIVGGYFIDTCGRKLSIIVSSVMYFIGSIILAVSWSYEEMILGRIVLGLAMALAGASECVYISEVAPSSVRGQLISLNELGITIGILFSYFINLAFASDTISGWRYMFGLSGIGALIVFVTIMTLPKSPRYLLMKSKDNVAKEALFSVRLCVTEEEKALAIKEFEDMEKYISAAKDAKCFTLCNLSMLYPVFIGIGLVGFQQCSGEPNILFYANTILLSMGFHSDIVASLGAIGLGLAKVAATIVCLMLVDKYGRRVFLLIGCMLMTLTVLGISIVVHASNFDTQQICIDDDNLSQSVTTGNMSDVTTLSPLTNNEMSKWIGLGLLMLFISGYSISFGPISWIVLSEIFPVHVRGKLFSFCTSLNWALNLIISSTFLGFVERTGGMMWPFITYSIFCFTSILFVYFIIPETRGKSLEEVTALLNMGVQCKKKLHVCCCFSQGNIHSVPLITHTDSEL